MNIRILQLLEGARQATGLTVIIDVFRAFSVEAYFLNNGAKEIIPVGDVQEAYRLKEEHPDMILAGERRGRIVPGFDVGNSPSQLMALDARGKTVVHTTSAGTQGIVNATQATEILGGSLVTAGAIAKYIQKRGIEDVSLVCMGLDAKVPIDEDTLCAEYIKSLLTGTAIDMETEMAKLKYTSGAKFFDPNQSEVFPEDDFHMCTRLNAFDFVLRLEKDEDGLQYMRKVTL